MPSHYLNHWWIIVNWTPRNKFQWNLNWNSFIFSHENVFENVVWKISAILPQCVKLGHGCMYLGLSNFMTSVDIAVYTIVCTDLGWAIPLIMNVRLMKNACIGDRKKYWMELWLSFQNSAWMVLRSERCRGTMMCCIKEQNRLLLLSFENWIDLIKQSRKLRWFITPIGNRHCASPYEVSSGEMHTPNM